MIKVTSRGSFAKYAVIFDNVRSVESSSKILYKYGQIGVNALKGATPVDSSVTSESWYYEIVDEPGYFAIHWYNVSRGRSGTNLYRRNSSVRPRHPYRWLGRGT